MNKLRGLDLFSGIGGISLALKPWVQTVAYCEREPYAQAVLLERMQSNDLDTAPIWDDVTTLDRTRLAMITELHEETEIMKKMPFKKMCSESVQAAVNGYNEGMSLADLAHVHGISRQAMHNLLKRRTKMRPQARFGKENHFYRGGKRADKRAHDLMEKAILRGELVNPGKCESCGNMGNFSDGRNSIQGHHDDYNYPLRVRWLCQNCHHVWHKSNKTIQFREGESGIHGDGIDIIFGGFP